VFCERNAFNLEQSREVLESGKRFGFKIKAHVDEFTNLGAARMAIELGATSIDHLDVISDGEIALLAASESVGVITPTVNFNFGSKEFANARKLIDAGCAIAVSTDYNPGSAPCPSLANAMAIACRYQKLLPSEAFNAATINAAFAVAKGAEIGSIETGKNADLLIFDTKDYREIAYEFGGNLIEKVFKKGKIVEEIK
jgi:imidazolonepropionase